MTGVPKNKREVIAQRIRALLALAERTEGNEAEAMLAAQRASEMMAKYQIATADLNISAKEESWGFRRRHFQDKTHYVRYCLIAIGRFTDCIPVWDNDQTVLAYFGTRMDTEIAHWLVAMFRDTMDREAARYVETVKGKVHGKTARVSFQQGMALRLCERLIELKDQQEGNVNRTLGSTALVVSKQAELKSKAKDAGLDETKQKEKTIRMHVASMEAGKEAGDRVALNPVVTDNSAETKRLT